MTSQEFEPCPSSLPDPCRLGQPFSGLRFSVFAALFLTMTLGGFVLFLLLSDQPYGIQFASVVCYTAAIGLYTFAQNRSAPPFMLSCPIVRQQVPLLLKRHAGFLLVLVILQTSALRLRLHLSSYWVTGDGKNMPPFYLFLTVLGCGLALAQILSNRSLLERAHVDAYPDLGL
jgi:hypothetical protein